MTKRSIVQALAGSVAASLLLFGVMSWPLARMATEAIPSSAQNVEHPSWRSMIPGDQLQLLYHFDLMRDMLHGRIPWFQNIYEFNQGDDTVGYRPGAYFFPMSGVYALLAERLGQAAGWNLTLWLSVALSTFFTWGWLRRFTADRLAAALGVAVVVLVPFRWISLFGGSPAGIALMWLPLLAWGLDVAIRRATLASGVWVGAVLLLLFWADLQIFYFTMLGLPIFAAISLLGHAEPLPWRRWWRPVPGALLFVVLISIFYLWRRAYLADSTMSGGRSFEEVLLFSPLPRGFWLGGKGPDDWIFLGFSLTLALALTWCVLLVRASGWGSAARDWRRIALLLLLLGAIGAACSLALGVYGPLRAAPLRAARAFLPHYEMIRQPAKIMGVLPLWIGWLLTMGLAGHVGDHPTWRHLKRGLAGVVLVGIVIEVTSSYSVTLCVLEPVQPAYERVVQEAARDRDGPGHLLALPLWPGDSLDSAVPLYYCQKYDLRMINGYSPVVSPDYIAQVFHRFESINQGNVSADQIDFLLERRIRFLVVHENLYPEKVSPFPVAEMLRRLKGHPRIQFLEQSGPVHAFRLLTPAEARVGRVPGTRQFPTAFPARPWEAELQVGEGGYRVADETASKGAAWQGAADGSASPAWFKTRPLWVAPAEDLAWWVRLRGNGRLQVQIGIGDDWLPVDYVTLSDSQWQWQVVPIPPVDSFKPLQLMVSTVEGQGEVDMVLLVGGPWPLDHWPDGGMQIPAVAFFRAGYSAPDGTSVVLRCDHDPDVELFYGPRLPLPIGNYHVELDYSSDVPDGTILGRLGVRFGRDSAAEWVPVISGSPAVLAVRADTNLPCTVALDYARTHDMTLHGVTITAVADSVESEALADAGDDR